MKMNVGIILFFLVSTQCLSQIKFENGYFIDNDNVRVSCLIRNVDWDDNPSKFNYKLTDDGEPKTETIAEVKEFGIGNEIKFIREKVQIDQSSDIVSNLTENRNPEYVEETVFLKLEVEGEINLYSYKSGNLRRYFIKEKDKEILPLIYKRYLVNSSKIAENNDYKQQIAIRLKCNSISQKEIRNLKYKKENLNDLFIKFNNCNGEKLAKVTGNSKGDFNLSVKAGMIFSQLSKSTKTFSNTRFEYGNTSNFRVGIELEYILPFNKNKWGIFFETAYWSNNSQIEVPSENVSGGILKADYKNSTIELPIGLKYYMFLSEKSKIFLSASHEFYYLNSKNEYKRIDNSTIYSFDDSGLSVGNFGFGAGFKYNNRFFIEGKFISFSGLKNMNLKYPSYTISIGYSLF